MEVLESAAACRDALERARAAGRTVGLVPTMGALHAGHVSLLARARAECDVVAVSIFVNPLQFGDPEDIARYPRTLERDLLVCAEAGADVVFVPPVSEMYPSWPAPPATTVSVRGVSDHWEGASRPGHFDGVATVVATLFSIAGCCRAYFGLKDFQQLAVVRRLVLDLSLPVEVVGCPIVREADGLALSSRNVRLSGAERAAATVLVRALAAGRAALGAGARSSAEVRRAMGAVVAGEPLVALDYAVAVDAASLEEAGAIDDPATVRLLIAAQVGPVRLIDNGAALEGADDVLAGADATGAVRQLERIG
jgi:pantoate--beta-alanine ligase